MYHASIMFYQIWSYLPYLPNSKVCVVECHPPLSSDSTMSSSYQDVSSSWQQTVRGNSEEGGCNDLANSFLLFLENELAADFQREANIT